MCPQAQSARSAPGRGWGGARGKERKRVRRGEWTGAGRAGGQGHPRLGRGGLCARSSVRRWGLGSHLARRTVFVSSETSSRPFSPAGPAGLSADGSSALCEGPCSSRPQSAHLAPGFCPQASDSREKANWRLTITFKKGDLYGKRHMSGNSGLCARFL